MRQLRCRAKYGFVGKRQRVDRNQSIAHREKIASIVRNWLRDELNESSTAENAPEFGMLYDDFLALVEPPLLAQLFEQLQYNRAATAARLGMHRSTLRQKMRKYDID